MSFVLPPYTGTGQRAVHLLRRRHKRRCNLQPESPLPAEAPFHIPAGCHDSTNLAAEFLLQRRPPGHELETESIIDHRETAGGERHPLPIDARNMLAFSRRLIGETRLGGQLCRGVFKLPSSQRGEQIAREDGTLSLSSREAFRSEMIG